MTHSRRDCLKLLALTGAALALPFPALAQGIAVKAIRVDNRQLLAAGGGQPAIDMKPLLEAELRRVFAGQM